MKKLLIILSLSSAAHAMNDIQAMLIKCTPPTETINEFLEKKQDPTTKNAIGFTLLHMASDIPTAQRLIKAGADINSRSSYGMTPLMYASMNGNTDLCEYLIDNGADVNAETPNKYKLLKPDDAGILLVAGAFLNEQLSGNPISEDNLPQHIISTINFGLHQYHLGVASALHYAAYFGHSKVCELLIAKGAQINHFCKEHYLFGNQIKTPLALAASAEHEATCSILLSLGADPKASYGILHRNTASYAESDPVKARFLLNDLLDHSDYEQKIAQACINTTLLCLNRINKLPRDIRKLILCWCTDRRDNLLTLIATGKINLKEIPPEFMDFFIDIDEYRLSIEASQKWHPWEISDNLELIKKQNLPFESILHTRYKHREFSQKASTLKATNERKSHIKNLVALAACCTILYILALINRTQHQN